MKAKVLKGFNAILTAVLALLGFNSCIPKPKYGCPEPEVELHISGEVVNEQKEPLQDIMIFSGPTDKEETIYPHISVNIQGHIEDWNNRTEEERESIRSYMPVTNIDGKYQKMTSISLYEDLVMIAVDPSGEYENDTAFFHDLEMQQNEDTNSVFETAIYVEQNFTLKEKTTKE